MVRVVVVVVVALVVAGVFGGRGLGVHAQEALSISGVVWFDTNADGIRQPHESGTRGHRILLSGPNGLSRETRTPNGGVYVFAGLAPGSYVVSVPDAVWMSVLIAPTTDPQPPYTQAVELVNTPVSGVDFGFAMVRDLTTYRGLAFVNASPADNPKVRAFIDGIDCTGPAQLLPTDLDPAFFSVSVLSSSLLDGCGEEGDVVTFTINGLAANESGIYSTPAMSLPGTPLVLPPNVPLPAGRSRLNLTVGPAFALYWPGVREVQPSGESEPTFGSIVGLIDDKVCAVGEGRVWASVMLIVPPDSMRPGCGTEGAIVRFAVDGFAAAETSIWRSGLGVVPDHPDELPGEDETLLTITRGPSSLLLGPRYAYFTLDLPAIPDGYIGQPTQFIEAVIDGTTCDFAGHDGPAQIQLAVPPEEIAEGCGSPDALVQLVLQGKIFAEVTWKPGFHEGPAVPDLNTHLHGSPGSGPLGPQPSVSPGSPQILPPSVGDAGLR